MKVKELIEKLKEFDPEAVVLVQDGSYCSDWAEIGEVGTSPRFKKAITIDGWDYYHE